MFGVEEWSGTVCLHKAKITSISSSPLSSSPKELNEHQPPHKQPGDICMGYGKELKFVVNSKHQRVSHLRESLWKESSSNRQVLISKLFVNMLILMATDKAILKAM